MNGGNGLGTVRSLLVAVAAALACSTACFQDASCEDAGREFPDGAHWTCSDGCNGCSCEDGTVTSTLIGCAGPPGPAAGKLKCFDGYWFSHGDTWSCTDDTCAECSCSDGSIRREPMCSMGEAGAGG